MQCGLGADREPRCRSNLIDAPVSLSQPSVIRLRALERLSCCCACSRSSCLGLDPRDLLWCPYEYMVVPAAAQHAACSRCLAISPSLLHACWHGSTRTASCSCSCWPRPRRDAERHARCCAACGRGSWRRFAGTARLRAPGRRATARLRPSWWGATASLRTRARNGHRPTAGLRAGSPRVLPGAAARARARTAPPCGRRSNGRARDAAYGGAVTPVPRLRSHSLCTRCLWRCFTALLLCVRR
jgi:hypothetical protein